MDLGNNFGKSVTDFIGNNPWKTALIVGGLMFFMMQATNGGGLLSGLFGSAKGAALAGGGTGLALTLFNQFFGKGNDNEPAPSFDAELA